MIMEYKRLTRNSENIVQQFENIKPENRNQFCLECFERLAELEDKIENRTLIELPCKVGDKAYLLPIEYEGNKVYYKTNAPVEITIDTIIIEQDLIRVLTKYCCCEIRYDLHGKLLENRNMFLTREEAEAKLKEY